MTGVAFQKIQKLYKANPKKINWKYLSTNPNPKAIKLLKANLKKIDWTRLSGNPSPEAIKLLKANPKKIDWYKLSGNPALFTETYDTSQITELPYAQELAQVAFRPDRLQRYLDMDLDLADF